MVIFLFQTILFLDMLSMLPRKRLGAVIFISMFSIWGILEQLLLNNADRS